MRQEKLKHPQVKRLPFSKISFRMESNGSIWISLELLWLEDKAMASVQDYSLSMLEIIPNDSIRMHNLIYH